MIKYILTDSLQDTIINSLVIKLSQQLKEKDLLSSEYLSITPFLVGATELFTATKKGIFFVGIPTTNGIYYFEADPNAITDNKRVYPDTFFGPVVYLPHRPNESKLVLNPHFPKITQNNYSYEYTNTVTLLLDTFKYDPLDTSDIRKTDFDPEFKDYTSGYIDHILNQYSQEGSFPPEVQAGLNK